MKGFAAGIRRGNTRAIINFAFPDSTAWCVAFSVYDHDGHCCISASSHKLMSSKMLAHSMRRSVLGVAAVKCSACSVVKQFSITSDYHHPGVEFGLGVLSNAVVLLETGSAAAKIYIRFVKVTRRAKFWKQLYNSVLSAHVLFVTKVLICWFSSFANIGAEKRQMRLLFGNYLRDMWSQFWFSDIADHLASFPSLADVYTEIVRYSRYRILLRTLCSVAVWRLQRQSLGDTALASTE